MTYLDNFTDRLHFVAASIPTGWGVTVETAAALIHEQHAAGQQTADILNRILNGTAVTADEIAAALTAWEAVA